MSFLDIHVHVQKKRLTNHNYNWLIGFTVKKNLTFGTVLVALINYNFSARSLICLGKIPKHCPTPTTMQLFDREKAIEKFQKITTVLLLIQTSDFSSTN